MNIEQVLQIKEQMLGDYSVQAVSGRALHKALESGKDYMPWIRSKIKSLKMDYDVHYTEARTQIQIGDSAQVGAHPLIVTDHIIPIDFAKVIAMMSKTDAGDRVREYFLACEKTVQTQVQQDLLTDPTTKFKIAFQDKIDILKIFYGTEPSHGSKVSVAVEAQVQVAQETGVLVPIPNDINKYLVESNNIAFDPNVDTAFASKVAVGRNYITVSQIAKDFHPLTSTDINMLLVNMGYLRRTGVSTYSVTSLGREFASTRTLQSGPNKGQENVTGWNLDDIRFWEPIKEMIIAQRDLKKRQLDIRRKNR